VSDFHTSDWPHWKTLSSSFKNSFPALKEDVYNAAGEIWPNALKVARHAGLDESDARAALFKAIAKVSNRDVEHIHSLNGYLFTTYGRLIRRVVDEQRRYTSLELINDDLSSDQMVAAVADNDILLREIVARMDPDLRRIYEGLILGYSFEELARKERTPANVLRSRFSRGIRRLAQEVGGRK
jgi:DNA-directed RNA polymerase specialized sigma24 family protein